MRVISARKVAAMPIDQVWDTLTGRFKLRFDDGDIETNYKETIYSRHFWEFHNLNPNTPLLMRHHVQGVLNGKRAGMNTHLKMINTILWDTYDTHISQQLSFEDYSRNPGGDIESRLASYALAYRYRLAETAYEVTNILYNNAVSRLGEYVMCMDAFDYLEVFDSDVIQKCYDRAEPTDVWIADLNNTINDFLNNDPRIRRNPLSCMDRSGLVSKQQVHQSIGVRGYVDGIDNIRFPYPVMRGYFQGMRTAHDYIVETQTAAMSLNSAKAPLQETEYFSRKLQQMCMTIERIHHVDCGSTRYLQMTIKPKSKHYKGDLCEILGAYYLDDDGVEKMITSEDTHLEGKTIKMRSAIFCKHPDPRGICARCYGGLSESIPAGSNFGHINCVMMTEQSGQGVLSTRHSAKSSEVAGAVVPSDLRPFMKPGLDNNSYVLTEGVKAKSKNGSVKLLISCSDAPNLADINKVANIRDIAVTRFSEVEICILSHNGVDIPLEVGIPKRKASITHAMLEYIAKNGIVRVDNDQWFEVDLKDWDFHSPFVCLPLRNFSMADHSKEIAAILESSVTEAMERDRFAQPASVLVELFSLVNERLSVNISVLAVTLYAAMIRSAEHSDYALPKPHTQAGLGVLKNVMLNRSASAYMAYERHSEFINSPRSFVQKNRMEHPFDAIIMPNEVLERSTRRRGIVGV